MALFSDTVIEDFRANDAARGGMTTGPAIPAFRVIRGFWRHAPDEVMAWWYERKRLETRFVQILPVYEDESCSHLESCM